jgi:membrane protein
MQADARAPDGGVPTQLAFSMTDRSTATKPHEVLRRNTDDAGRAREAAHEMERPGALAAVRGFLKLLWATIYAFFGDGCSSMAASLSFYTFLSLPALLTLLLAVVGRVADPAQVEGAIVAQVSRLIGPASAAQVASIISNANRSPHAASVATVVSLVALAFGATTAFAQLQSALNKAWAVKPDPHRNQLRVFLIKRVFSFGILLMVAFMLLVSLALSTVIAAISAALTSRFGIPPALLQVATALGSLLLIAVLFAAMFRYLPDARISWHDVRAGALGTAVLFVLGRTLIGMYLGGANPGSVYGAAGSLALVLIWVYYTSMILLFGAEFTKLWAQRYGKGIVPVKGAVSYVEEERSVRSG